MTPRKAFTPPPPASLSPAGARSRQHRGHGGGCGVTARSDPPASRIEPTQHHMIDPIITNNPDRGSLPPRPLPR
jgi:hypothetical protein